MGATTAGSDFDDSTAGRMGGGVVRAGGGGRDDTVVDDVMGGGAGGYNLRSDNMPLDEMVRQRGRGGSRRVHNVDHDYMNHPNRSVLSVRPPSPASSSRASSSSSSPTSRRHHAGRRTGVGNQRRGKKAGGGEGQATGRAGGVGRGVRGRGQSSGGVSGGENGGMGGLMSGGSGSIGGGSDRGGDSSSGGGGRMVTTKKVGAVTGTGTAAGQRVVGVAQRSAASVVCGGGHGPDVGGVDRAVAAEIVRIVTPAAVSRMVQGPAVLVACEGGNEPETCRG